MPERMTDEYEKQIRAFGGSAEKLAPMLAEIDALRQSLAEKERELADNEEAIGNLEKAQAELVEFGRNTEAALASTREELAAAVDLVAAKNKAIDQYRSRSDAYITDTGNLNRKAADLEAKLTAARENEDAAITEAKRQCSAKYDEVNAKLLMTEKAEGLAQQLAASESRRKALAGQVERLLPILKRIESMARSVAHDQGENPVNVLCALTSLRIGVESALSETAAKPEEG